MKVRISRFSFTKCLQEITWNARNSYTFLPVDFKKWSQPITKTSLHTYFRFLFNHIYIYHIHILTPFGPHWVFRCPNTWQCKSIGRADNNLNMFSLTHWGLDKMDAISQTTFSSAFSWMKMFEFRLKFHWSLFLRVQLTISQHWFRWWFGAVQATSHHLSQWCLVYQRIYASFGLNELKSSITI